MNIFPEKMHEVGRVTNGKVVKILWKGSSALVASRLYGALRSMHYSRNFIFLF